MVFGYIYVNNKALVYGRFVNQRKEFKQKTGVDEIRLTEDKDCSQVWKPKLLKKCKILSHQNHQSSINQNQNQKGFFKSWEEY